MVHDPKEPDPLFQELPAPKGVYNRTENEPPKRPKVKDARPRTPDMLAIAVYEVTAKTLRSEKESKSPALRLVRPDEQS